MTSRDTLHLLISLKDLHALTSRLTYFYQRATFMPKNLVAISSPTAMRSRYLSI